MINKSLEIYFVCREQLKLSYYRNVFFRSFQFFSYELSGEHAYQSPLTNIKRFFQKMTDPLFNLRVDVYRWIFFVEFVGLIVLVATYKSFWPYTAATDSVANYIQDSKVSYLFDKQLTCSDYSQ